MLFNEKFSINQIKECLDESGYFMKSRLVRLLKNTNFLVDPDVLYESLKTEKTLKIDLIATHLGELNDNNATVETKFVINSINNKYPIILLTEFPSHPNVELIDCIRYHCNTSNLDLFLNSDSFYFPDEKGANEINLFSQYCEIIKNAEDNKLYTKESDVLSNSLLDIAEYCEMDFYRLSEIYDDNPNVNAKYWRLLFWQPILVISGQLIVEQTSKEGIVQLIETPLARIAFKSQDIDDKYKISIIEVIREDFLLERLNSVLKHDIDIQNRISTFRNNFNKSLIK